jgi:hypothetical protein
MTDFGLALVLILAWAYLIASTVAALRFARRPIVAPHRAAAGLGGGRVVKR